MADILVTTASDTDTDGLTLREALAQADLDAAADTGIPSLNATDFAARIPQASRLARNAAENTGGQHLP